MRLFIAKAADVLLEGGLVTCPTEGLFGLSCMPDDPLALLRLLKLKKRDPSKGLILIAADRAQLHDWIDLASRQIRIRTRYARRRGWYKPPRMSRRCCGVGTRLWRSD